MAEKTWLWLMDIVLVLFIFVSFLATAVIINDKTLELTFSKSKDLPLFHDVTLAAPHNLNYSYTLPKDTKMVINPLVYKMGLAQQSKRDDQALIYSYTQNKNIALHFSYDLKQPKNSTGSYKVIISNE